MDQATATLQQRISHLAARPQTVGKADRGAGKPRGPAGLQADAYPTAKQGSKGK